MAVRSNTVETFDAVIGPNPIEEIGADRILGTLRHINDLVHQARLDMKRGEHCCEDGRWRMTIHEYEGVLFVGALAGEIVKIRNQLQRCPCCAAPVPTISQELQSKVRVAYDEWRRLKEVMMTGNEGTAA